MKSKYLCKIILIILIVSIISGCTMNQKLSENDYKENEQVENENEISLDVSGKDNDLLIRSEGISDSVVNLYGIDNATSIIFNDMVAIAVELAEGYKLDDDMREMIMNAATEKDPMIRQVLITENEDIFDEIESVIGALLNGQSYDNQVKTINRIIEKIKNE